MPTIRSSSILAFNAGSVNIPWPAGTVAGDTVFIFFGGGWNVNSIPAGWTQGASINPGTWDGSICFKIMDAADITAGSGTFGFGGSFNAVYVAVTMIGAAYPRAPRATNDLSGSGTGTVNANPGTLATDLCLLFGSNRAASNDTVNVGSVERSVNASNSSACLYSYTPPSDGSFTATFSYSSGGAGKYQAIVSVSDTPVNNDAQVSQLADVVLGQSTNPKPRVSQLVPVVLGQKQAHAAQVSQMAVVLLLSFPRRLGPQVF